MKRFRPVLFATIAVAVSLPGLAATRANVTPAEVAGAINRFGIPISPQQVVLLSDIVAASAHPALRVESVQRWDDRQLMARLSCANPGECVPFFVALRLDPQTQTQISAQASAPLSAAMSPERMALQPPMVRAGTPATLLLDGDHVHIRLTVICLQNGAAGQTIRATDKERRIFYTAQVADHGLLKGRL
ncbi:MAG: hypothetical protein WBD46_17525 [Acidobacteriaceae bacterium]